LRGCPLVSCLYERYEVRLPDPEDAVVALARLMASDLRARPATVTAPMIRLVARLVSPPYESGLATECYGCAKYLDCDCASVNPRFEAAGESSATAAA